MKPEPFAVSEVALPEYFGFPCQFSSHRVLDIHQSLSHRRYLVSTRQESQVTEWGDTQGLQKMTQFLLTDSLTPGRNKIQM
jgi:hypothetical protein